MDIIALLLTDGLLSPCYGTGPPKLSETDQQAALSHYTLAC